MINSDLVYFEWNADDAGGYDFFTRHPEFVSGSLIARC